METKKLKKLVLACGLVAALGVGATLAYFTDQESATNVITMGHADIDIDEPNFDPDKEIEDVKPGDVITKDPTVTVTTDSVDVYVRFKITFTGLTQTQVNDLMSKKDDGTYKYLDINPRFWREEVNTNEAYSYYFYYTLGSGVLTAGDQVKLFDTVTIPEKWGNEIAGETFNIVVGADAVQADNFTPGVNADGVYGWYYSDGTVVTPQTYNPNANITETE